VVLKVSEGLADAMGKMLKAEFNRRLISRLGYLLARPAFQGFRKKVDYAEYGGAPLLGIQGTGMICHGRSSARAVMNAIRLAHDFEERQVNVLLVERLAEISANLQAAQSTEGGEASAALQQGALS
jgi:glycerol-3-phosphate acyltransferase PlsX